VLFDYDNVKDGRTLPFLPGVAVPGLLPNEMEQLAEALTGNAYDMELNPFSTKVGDKVKQALENVGTGREIPVLINYHPSGEGLQETSPHYVLVTGYDPETGMVSISNPWGREEQFPLDVLQSHLIASVP